MSLERDKQPEREVEAVYEEGVLRPLEPLDLPSGTRVRVRLAPANSAAGVEGSGSVRATAHASAPSRPGSNAALLAGGLTVALLAQLAVAGGLAWLGVPLYLLAVVGVVAGARAPGLAPLLVAPVQPLFNADRRFWLTVVALLAGAVAFANASGNVYRPANVLPWLVAVACFWLAHSDAPFAMHDLQAWLGKQRSEFVSNARRWLTRERLIVLGLLGAILALGAGFRFAALAANPLDMNSDQAEKLLDVGDLLNGQYHIFFERNTGREPWQFYWTFALIKLFGLRPDFLALKLGTSLIGWLMLPAVFLLARELLGTRAALLATLFAAVASWGVIAARYGLRYPLAPCAVAWTLFFLVRGLRRDSRNSMLAAGVWMGIGLQGYTAYRFMLVVAPLLVGLWIVWLLTQKRHALALRAAASFGLAVVLAALTMLPLLRYGLEHPDMLFYRAATRLTDAEQSIAGNPALIFLGNLRNVLLMFNSTRDEVWVANLPDRPAMDVLLGGLLVAGAAGVLALGWRTRNWWPALTLLAGVLMLVPSALSIAFPNENPSVVRTGGALPALMVVCAAGPAMLLEALRGLGRDRLYRGALVGVAALGLLVVVLNQRRVFVDYPAQYCPRAQNASDIGRELEEWLSRGGERTNAWLIGYPHWVDTRAVGVWIGDIGFANSVMGAEQAARVDLSGRPGWFALNRDDLPVLQALYAKYPQGQERLVEGSQCAGRAFVVFETQPGQ